MQTPWGRSDRCDKLAEGVYRVGTPSHGGYLVSQKVAESGYLSQAARLFVGERWAQWYAFEEDCAWVVIAREHPELFSAEDKARNPWYFAEDGLSVVLNRYYPQYVRQLT